MLNVSSAMEISGSSILAAPPTRVTWQAQPGTVGVLRLEEGNRADVTLYDLKTLLPTLTIQLREERVRVEAHLRRAFPRP